VDKNQAIELFQESVIYAQNYASDRAYFLAGLFYIRAAYFKKLSNGLDSIDSIESSVQKFLEQIRKEAGKS
jgi:hypothetical protein